MLYAWVPTAIPAVIAGLSDDAWRVREMCAKVARRHRLTNAAGFPPVELKTDDVPRVREAAKLALAAIS